MERYRIILVPDEPAALIPAPRRRSRRRLPLSDPGESLRPAIEALLRALRRVNRRGPGASAWASVADDPISFLLECMSDPILLRDREGQTIYANPAARDLDRQRTGEFREHHFFLETTNPQLILTLYSRVR